VSQPENYNLNFTAVHTPNLTQQPVASQCCVNIHVHYTYSSI